MSSKVDLIRKDLLKRKINEYFSKNPNKQSVVITAGNGFNRLFFNVRRNSSGFSITEVSTKREEYIFEDATNHGGKGSGFEYDPDQKPSGGTAAAGQEKSPFPKDFDAGPARTNTQAIESEPWHPDNTKGRFARLVKDKGMKQAMLSMPDHELKKHFGIGKQALQSGGSDPYKAMGKGMKQYTGTSGYVESKNINEADDGAVFDKESDERPEDTVGLETDYVEPSEKEKDQEDAKASEEEQQSQGEEEQEQGPQTAEHLALTKTLSGQTIQNARMELNDSGAVLTLELAGVENPAKVEWRKGGDVIYYFKDRPYRLSKSEK